MNKKITMLTTLAILSCGVAHAQSSVTLYGILDIGVEYLNHVPSGSTSKSQIQMTSGNLLGSRWGLKGDEDLGGGLHAIFDLQSGFSLSTGQLALDRLFGFKADVGLSGDWGRLTIGRQFNLLFDQMYAYDPLWFGFYGAYAQDPGLANFFDNAVEYVGSYAGIQFSALYSTGVDSTIANGAQVPGASKVGRAYSFSLIYKRPGPLSAGLAYEQIQGTSIETQDQADQRLVAGVNYVIGSVTLYAGYRWLNARNQISTLSSNLFWTGFKYVITPPLTVSVGAYKTVTRGIRTGPTSAVILGQYFLSKRTSLYAQVSTAWNTKDTNISVAGVPHLTVDGATQTGAMIGIQHFF